MVVRRPRRPDRRGRRSTRHRTSASHLYIYRHRPDVNGVVHTHSRYATAFAAVGRPIPVYLTAQADEFGGEIPCAGFAVHRRRGDRGARRRRHRALARDPAQAPRRLHHRPDRARPRSRPRSWSRTSPPRSGPRSRSARPTALPDDVVERLHRRYTTMYGQRPRDVRRRPAMLDLGALEIWFVTGSQHLYGPETLATVARQAPEVAAALDASAVDPGPGRGQAGRDRRRRIRAVLPGGQRVARRASASSSGCTRSRRPRCGSPGLDVLQRPLLHLHTQYHREIPWDTIDMDFMNLNQAAHGDREFGFIAARMRLERKVVVGHWSDPEVQDRDRGLVARRRGEARLADRPDRPLRRQHARGGRHRGRQGRGPAPARVQRQHATASATWSAVVDAVTDAGGRRPHRDLPRRVRGRRRPAPGRRARGLAARRRADRGRPPAVPRATAASPRSRRRSRTSTA